MNETTPTSLLFIDALESAMQGSMETLNALYRRSPKLARHSRLNLARSVDEVWGNRPRFHRFPCTVPPSE
jgi:hypothetical protein